jgi:hypothetical protein
MPAQHVIPVWNCRSTSVSLDSSAGPVSVRVYNHAILSMMDARSVTLRDFLYTIINSDLNTP